MEPPGGQSIGKYREYGKASLFKKHLVGNKAGKSASHKTIQSIRT